MKRLLLALAAGLCCIVPARVADSHFHPAHPRIVWHTSLVKRHKPKVQTHRVILHGIASWYDEEGNRTAVGDRFDPRIHRCAMRIVHELPRRTRVTVHNVANGRTSWCIVNDYGPAAWTGRLIDVTPVVRDDLRMGGLASVTVAYTLPGK